MAKTATKTVEQAEETKARKTPKEKKEKVRGPMVGRVRKVIKKTKRKLSDDKFEKELQRTIAFLEQLQGRIAGNSGTNEKTAAKAEKKAAGNGVGKTKKSQKAHAMRVKKTSGRAPKRRAGEVAS